MSQGKTLEETQTSKSKREVVELGGSDSKLLEHGVFIGGQKRLNLARKTHSPKKRKVTFEIIECSSMGIEVPKQNGEDNRYFS